LKQYLKFEYFYIVFILIWEPLQRFVLKVDGAGITISIFTIFLFFKLLKKSIFTKVAFSKPLIIWGVWVIYAFLNTVVIGMEYDIPYYTFFTLLFVPYILMVNINILSITNPKILLNVLIFGLYLSIVLILILNNNPNTNDRLGGGMNSNTIGMMAAVLSMFLYLKYFNKDISAKVLLVFGIIPVFTIISTGSRTAFGGFLLLMLSHFIINRSRSKLLNLFKISFGILIVLIPLNYILENTNLGERIKSTTEQGDQAQLDTGNVFLDKFGDRGVFYYVGWQVFKENPLNGIGLENYIFYTEGEEEQHSEYMIQLAELGIIGFILFFTFYLTIFNKLRKLKRNSNIRNQVEIYFAFVIIILLMISVTRMYRVGYLFSVIGVVTGYIARENYLNNRKAIIIDKYIKNNNT
jgi:O-antigen ligase